MGWFLAKVLWRTAVVRARNVPKRGPVILVANHVGFVDGPVLHGVAPRPTHFLVKEEMFVGMLGRILRSSGQIEVDATGREALARARRILRRGGAVGVFPEGTRGSGTADTVHGGAAWLALHGPAPVVPVALFGTRLTGEKVGIWPHPGRRMRIEFGAPVPLNISDDLKGKVRQEAAERAVAEALRMHLSDAATRSPIPLPIDDPVGEARSESGRA